MSINIQNLTIGPKFAETRNYSFLEKCEDCGSLAPVLCGTFVCTSGAESCNKPRSACASCYYADFMCNRCRSTFHIPDPPSSR